jgi:hypothetical protein
MAENETNREEELRQLLTDAIEVQLAALKAGIGFWTEWIDRTTEFVDTASKTLSNINSDDPQTKDVLLELVDAGRASARALTEIPRNTATRFIEELDKFEAKKLEAKASTPAAKKATTPAAKKATTRSRAGAKATSRPASPAAKKTGGSARTKKRARPKRAGRVKQ